MATNNGASTSTLSGSRQEELTATHIEVDKSAIKALDAEQASFDKSALQRVRAAQATFDRSAVGFATFEQGTMNNSNAGVVLARNVEANEVRTFVLASPVVRGTVHTWLDLRSAVAIGFGMVLGKLAISAVRGLARRATR